MLFIKCSDSPRKVKGQFDWESLAKGGIVATKEEGWM